MINLLYPFNNVSLPLSTHLPLIHNAKASGILKCTLHKKNTSLKTLISNSIVISQMKYSIESQDVGVQ